MRNLLQFLINNDLTPHAAQVLSHLREKGTSIIKDLRFGFQPSGANATLGRLEDKGFITREKGPGKNRLAKLSKAGRTVARLMHQAYTNGSS